MTKFKIDPKFLFVAKNPKNPKRYNTSLVVPDLKNFRKISDDFLSKEEQKAKIYARWELHFLWTRFRDLTVKELFELDTDPTTSVLKVSECIIVKQLQYIIKSNDMSQLDRVYDRLLGKPKEAKEEKTINDIEFTVDILKNEIEGK